MRRILGAFLFPIFGFVTLGRLMANTAPEGESDPDNTDLTTTASNITYSSWFTIGVALLIGYLVTNSLLRPESANIALGVYLSTAAYQLWQDNAKYRERMKDLNKYLFPALLGSSIIASCLFAWAMDSMNNWVMIGAVVIPISLVTFGIFTPARLFLK